MSIENVVVLPGGKEDTREGLERRADIARWKLVRTLDALARKRHDALDVRLQVRRHLMFVVVIGGGLVVLIVGGIASQVVASRPTRVRRRFAARWSALGRLWRHPDDVVRAREPVMTTVAKRVVTGLLTALLLRMGKRTLRLERTQLPASAP